MQISKIQSSKKETFHPGRGSEFPPYDLAHINKKKLFCLFRGGNFFFEHCKITNENYMYPCPCCHPYHFSEIIKSPVNMVNEPIGPYQIQHLKGIMLQGWIT